MASLQPPSGGGGAGGSASASQDLGPTLEETRQELRQLSPKISKCESALESGGSYIGISDPVILLEQLKVLQRKDNQLRDILLILLRASPLHAPRCPTSPLANAASLLPAPPQQPPQVQPKIPAAAVATATAPAATPAATPAPSTAPAVAPAPATAPAVAPAPSTAPAVAPAPSRPLSRMPARRSSSVAETQALRERARAAAAAAAPTPAPITAPSAAAAAPSSALPSTSTPPPPYERSVYRPPSPIPSIPPGKTLSLHEALGLVPPPRAAPAAAPAIETSTLQPKGRPGVNHDSSGDVQIQRSLSSPKPPTYFPGRHALYRTSVPSRGVGSAAAASSPGLSSTSGARRSGKSSPEDFQRREPFNGYAGRGRSPAQAVASGSSTEGGRSSGEKTRTPGITASVAAATVANPCGGSTTPLAEEVREGFAPAGAGAGHVMMATTVAVGGSNDHGAKVRELAEVAAAFNKKIRTGRSSPVPAPASGEEVFVGSSAKSSPTSATHLEDGGTSKQEMGTATENREIDAALDGAATDTATVAASAAGTAAAASAPASDSVARPGVAAGMEIKKQLMKTSKATVSTRAKSAQPARENKRKTAPRPGLRVSTRRTRASMGAIGGTAPASSPVFPPLAEAAYTGISSEKEIGKSTAESSGGSAGTVNSATGDGHSSDKDKGKSSNRKGKCGYEKTSAEPDVDVSRCDNKEYGGKPASHGGSGSARKRRKSAETGGWRSRYNADEFELGELNSSSFMSSSSFSGGSDTESDEEQPREASGGDDGEWDETLVDVGGEDGNDDDGFGDSGGMRRVKLIRKRDPPNAWKRRCADGTCLLGASFGYEGKQAVYCSAHKDAGMVNVTHRRCEEPGCPHQPSFNMEGEKKASYCRAHKRDGMINVSSPRCGTPGCMVRPSFGYLGEKRATFCDAHKKSGMMNIRRRRGLYPLQGTHPLPPPASIEEDDREGKKKNGRESRAKEAAASVPAHLAQNSALPFAAIPTPMSIVARVSAPSVPGSGSDDDGGEGVDVGGAPVSIVGVSPRGEEGVTPMEVISSAA